MNVIPVWREFHGSKNIGILVFSKHPTIVHIVFSQAEEFIALILLIFIMITKSYSGSRLPTEKDDELISLF